MFQGTPPGLKLSEALGQLGNGLACGYGLGPVQLATGLAQLFAGLWSLWDGEAFFCKVDLIQPPSTF